MENLGYKKITLNNWLEPDTMMENFVRFLPNGNTESVPANSYVQSIIEPKLHEKVPIEIHRLFEIARGAMVY
tara:strand:- start:42571 stop:42786 length:216 start_codon:yes stop_codon:yes gene_type:complete